MTDILRCRHCGKVLAVTDLPEKISSVEIARIFHKRHRAVMRDIKIILASEIRLHTFVQSEYKNLQEHKQPCFTVNREGFRILAKRYRVTYGCTEIKSGKRCTRVYGLEPIEIVCDRCGEVNVF